MHLTYLIGFLLYNRLMSSEKTIYDWKRYWVPYGSHEESYFEYS